MSNYDKYMQILTNSAAAEEKKQTILQNQRNSASFIDPKMQYQGDEHISFSGNQSILMPDMPKTLTRPNSEAVSPKSKELIFLKNELC